MVPSLSIPEAWATPACVTIVTLHSRPDAGGSSAGSPAAERRPDGSVAIPIGSMADLRSVLGGGR